MEKALEPKVFVLDVDGVLTTGQFFYGTSGKLFKVFGADDNDALSLLGRHLEIRFLSGDKKGFEISRKRVVDDMGYPLDLVSTFRRKEWLAERLDLRSVIYMGDGIFDHLVMREVGYAIAPANAHPYAKAAASYVTPGSGGNRAVAEACLHILERFFEPFTSDSRVEELRAHPEGTTV
jgi:3-deoxy-D-manno-octulosonate 8-phosphate phosphatase (KDO 8-P phosphatase)